MKTLADTLMALAEGATSTPWEVDEGYQEFAPQQPLRIRYVDIDADNDGQAHDYGHVICEFPDDHVNDDTDAALIVALRNALPEILKALDGQDALTARVAEPEAFARNLHPDVWAKYDKAKASLSVTMPATSGIARSLFESQRLLALLPAHPAEPQPVQTYADFQQRRGMLADIIESAIAEYEGWMDDDHYDARVPLDKIIERLKSARDIYDTPAQPVQTGGVEAACEQSPFGRHQVDTSMESGPNNCFFCEQPMGKR